MIGVSARLPAPLLHSLLRSAAALRHDLTGVLALAFDHLPKTAGTSLTAAIQSQYSRRVTYYLNHASNPRRAIDVFRRLSPGERASYRLVLGHGANGLFRHLPPGFIRATVLREPVARIVSHYHYVKRSPENYFHRTVVERRLALKDYCATGNGELNNYYVEHFTGLHPEDLAALPGETLVTLALANLRRDYDVIGFTDQLPDFVERLCRATGLRPFELPRLNVAPERQEPSSEEVAAISAANSLDLELYRRLKSSPEIKPGE